MAGTIDKIPAETRWKIATKVLTGAYTACAVALKKTVSEEEFNDFHLGIWAQAAKVIRDLADSLGLPVENAGDIVKVMELISITVMGPELQFEVVEVTEDRCVARYTSCPWHERWKELGIREDICSTLHQGWADGVLTGLNPDFAFNLTESMACGDPYCEWVLKRKRRFTGPKPLTA